MCEKKVGLTLYDMQVGDCQLHYDESGQHCLIWAGCDRIWSYVR